MFLATAKQMLEIENLAMKEQGTTIDQLMAKAGQKVADLAMEVCKRGRVAVFAGKGNNGGDGFVAAKILHQSGYDVTVVTAVELGNQSGPAGKAYHSLIDLGVEIVSFNPNLNLEADLVIDALFGFGLKGEVRGILSEVINYINDMSAPVLSVDIPSGILSDTGQVAGVAVKANYTVTFTIGKYGLYLFPGAEYAGKIVPVDIGISEKTASSHAGGKLIDFSLATSLLPQRSSQLHKYSAGTVLVIGGSVGMTGAAAMAAKSALRAGAGLVRLAVPKSLNQIMEIKLTEVVTIPLPETEVGSLDVKSLDELLERRRENDAIIIGPGLGRHPSTQELVRQLVAKVPNPLVVDADALFALSGDYSCLLRRSGPTVLTPHASELGRLMGIGAKEVEDNRVGNAFKAARELNSTVILKGPHSLVSSSGRVDLNLTGNSGMASAGTGDVLAGMVASFMAQGLSAHQAASLAVYLHGLAGDLAAAELSEFALLAGDLIDFLPKAIKKVLSEA
jgi:NAD(P)H-hydrate epimerase